ncbi:FixH family protein [Thalassotalea sp. M1531]|uniref:FixH family protein n=1 Tax=Thalassotalea algicola TaxID=2716224 RepID=A0A7Y0LD93_9GAMM|nr:FixH family protein [Thalassotalea algicola]NMP31471.1 FixH family protein [Thalassotalea algicola]
MKTPWYKEPWAWLVFFLPLSAVIAGITTLIIANTDPDDLVVGDYYKKGKAINIQVSKVKHAQKLGMKFGLKLANNELIITPLGIEREFPIINANFYHPTQQEKDFYLALTPDGNGDFRHTFDQKVSGKWRVTISSFENNWKIQSTIALPQANFIELIPNPAEAQ